MSRSAFIFVSQPTAMSKAQVNGREFIFAELAKYGLVGRTVGLTDHAPKNPIAEVCLLAKHCSGGLVLGFQQAAAASVVYKPGTNVESAADHASFPSPWNQLEAGVLVSMQRPLLVVREQGIAGGIFDPGAGEHYVNPIDLDRLDDPAAVDGLQQTIATWAGDVWQTYRSAWP